MSYTDSLKGYAIAKSQAHVPVVADDLVSARNAFKMAFILGVVVTVAAAFFGYDQKIPAGISALWGMVWFGLSRGAAHYELQAQEMLETFKRSRRTASQNALLSINNKIRQPELQELIKVLFKDNIKCLDRFKDGYRAQLFIEKPLHSVIIPREVFFIIKDNAIEFSLKDHAPYQKSIFHYTWQRISIENNVLSVAMFPGRIPSRIFTYHFKQWLQNAQN